MWSSGQSDTEERCSRAEITVWLSCPASGCIPLMQMSSTPDESQQATSANWIQASKYLHSATQSYRNPYGVVAIENMAVGVVELLDSDGTVRQYTMPVVKDSHSYRIITTLTPPAMSRDVIDRRSLVTPGPFQLFAFALLLTAQVGLTFLLVTLLLAKVRRTLSFYNLLVITWVLVPIYLLLFYTKQYDVPQVHSDICAAQAILKHGVDSAFLVALFLLAFEVL
ncbi:hypothetical protein SISNIDRAFT_351779 [Sistotremastrum niveocremeum HHB9708]|uniref:Uncharacterized protein n=1 Tax=Sistotremastrum niveocremeum HHB9708 TaxID=1314777 RepID=A0A164X209_9AGAM|nr:hypothetical protein SISNIDRAFT_351779 [Sistotremastrum niveocremeum HHB9708]